MNKHTQSASCDLKFTNLVDIWNTTSCQLIVDILQIIHKFL